MKKYYIHIISLLIFLSAGNSLKAQSSDTLYTVDAYVGAGYGYYITDMDTEGLKRGGLNLSFRIMWQPEHLLSVGLYTGYIEFFRFEKKNAETEGGTTDITSSLTAVPIGIVFSMRITDELSFTAGTSAYFLTSHAESHGNEVNSSEASTGSLFSLTYTKQVSTNLAVGGELKYNFVNKIQDGSLSLSAVLKYTLLEY